MNGPPIAITLPLQSSVFGNSLTRFLAFLNDSLSLGLNLSLSASHSHSLSVCLSASLSHSLSLSLYPRQQCKFEGAYATGEPLLGRLRYPLYNATFNVGARAFAQPPTEGGHTWNFQWEDCQFYIPHLTYIVLT